MSSYRVNLDVFAGPLDLLLYLIRKDEVDIYDISISKITDQYLGYVEMLKNLDIDLAGDFLVMAATLMQIKSAMLLPKADPDQLEAEDFEDPRSELIRQLLEYKKYKDAANMLDACAEDQKQRASRPSVIINKLKDDTEPELDLDQVSVWDLLESFDAILKATGGHHFDVSHIFDDTPIDLYQIELLHRLQNDGAMPFARIFHSAKNRLMMVGLFLALLELIRDSLVAAEQDESTKELYVKALTDEPAEQAVQKTIAAGIQGMQEEAQAADEKTAEEISGQQPGQQVPIVELPAQKKEAPTAEPAQPQPDSVPIAELPLPKASSTKEKKEPVHEEAKSEEDSTN